MTRSELQAELILNIKAVGSALHITPADLLFSKDAAGLMSDEEFEQSIVIARDLVSEARAAALSLLFK